MTSSISSCVALNFSSKTSNAFTASGLYCTISITVLPDAVSVLQPDSSAAEIITPAMNILLAVFIRDFIKNFLLPFLP